MSVIPPATERSTGRVSRRFMIGGSAGAAGAVLLAGRTAPAQAKPRLDQWTTTWATPQQPPTEGDDEALEGFTEQTLRHVVRVAAGGGRLRLRLSNTYATDSITIGPVTVAKRPDDVAGATPVIETHTLTSATFDGESTTDLAAGAVIITDPIDLPVDTAEDLVLSIYLSGPTGPISFHRNVYATSFVADGNEVDSSGEAFQTKTSSVYLLTAVEVAGSRTRGLAVLGDSITEGAGTPSDENLRLTDQIAVRLNRRGGRVGVSNLGISGNRMLLDSDRFGVNAQSRLDRDVLALSGIDTMLVVMGVNDLQQEPHELDADKIISAFRQLSRRAAAQGVRTVGATITPFKGWDAYTEELEAVRQDVNNELRRARVVDAVADFDKALRDPSDSAKMQSKYDSGDGLHPNVAGNTAMAEAVPRHLFAD